MSFSHYEALAAKVAADHGLRFEELVARNRSKYLVDTRRKALRALRDAGASWSECAAVMKRDPRGVAAFLNAYKRPKRDRVCPTHDSHWHGCDCDTCLNGP